VPRSDPDLVAYAPRDGAARVPRLLQRASATPVARPAIAAPASRESRRSVCVSGDTRHASPASAGFAEREPLPAAWGSGSRSDLLASVARSVASRHRRQCLAAGLERWSRKVKRSVLPAGKGRWPSRPGGRCTYSGSDRQSVWWQVRRFGGRGRGRLAPAPSGRSAQGPQPRLALKAATAIDPSTTSNVVKRTMTHLLSSLAVSPQTRRYARSAPLRARGCPTFAYTSSEGGRSTRLLSRSVDASLTGLR
jgi:hypothetical protein